MQNSARSLRGFTLMELLITVALIGVLLGIGMPMLGSAQKQSQAESCTAQCLALENAANSTAMTAMESELPPSDNDPLDTFSTRPLEGKAAEAKAMAALEKLPQDYAAVCPGGGRISIYPDLLGNIHLVCSLHGQGAMQYFDPTVSIRTGFDKVVANGARIAARIDSTSKMGPNIRIMFPYLPSYGSHNIATWATKNNSSSKKIEYVVWSDIDITKLAYGASVPVMRYNVDTNTYEVWEMKVKKSTDNNEVYKVLDFDRGTQCVLSADAGTADKTFANALTWYDQVKKAYP
ncbi:MAG: prepilin-type N-terminal cleavage/methylation domain-containing protein [Clostridia bacterium]|nr:prepilin-type N-terminal cleavage/methylation domain-containing protein [Clostridia bacterium]